VSLERPGNHGDGDTTEIFGDQVTAADDVNLVEDLQTLRGRVIRNVASRAVIELSWSRRSCVIPGDHARGRPGGISGQTRGDLAVCVAG